MHTQWPQYQSNLALRPLSICTCSCSDYPKKLANNAQRVILLRQQAEQKRACLYHEANFHTLNCMKQNSNNLLDVLSTLFRWKRPLIILCLCAAVGTAAISLLLPNYYEGVTVFLAISPDQATPQALYGENQNRIEYYGNDNDNDRIMTIAQSADLLNFLIDSFQLYEHYGINPDGNKAAYKVRNKLLSRYDVEKTKRDAIALSVEDRDRELAANMANAARDKISELARKLIREGQEKSLRSYEDNITSKEYQLQVLGDSLVNLRRQYGIYSIEGQSEALTTQVSETEMLLVSNQGRLEALRNSSVPRDTIVQIAAKVSGLEASFNTLNERMERFNEGMAKVGTYDRQYLIANATLSEDKERLKQLRAVYESEIPSIVVVETAEVPIIKSRPKRSLIVIAAVALAFFFGVIGILLLDTYQDVDWKRIYRGE